MRFVKYPQTEKDVSVVGFGGLRFDLEKSNEENAELVLYAYEKGIGIIDDLMEAYVWFSLASGDDALNDSDASRLLLTLNLTYPAPSEEELETTVSEQKKSIVAYQKEVNK